MDNPILRTPSAEDLRHDGEMGQGFRIQICSDIDYDQLIAEIYFDDQFLALISQEDGTDRLKIEFLDKKPLKRKLDLGQFQDALREAASILTEG